MARLLSHHDKYHVHAVLGMTALVHFLYRFGCLFIHREESFDPSYVSAIALCVHVLLHVTSFQFVLPQNRIWTKPMLWREFRAHNAIFAYRHIVGALLGIWFRQFWMGAPSVYSMITKLALVLGACAAADLATQKMGDTAKRTTNAMPYPGKTSATVEGMAKYFYAKAQFAATAIAAFGCPSLSFASMLAIEIASFLMTLVRKGVIEARTYHIVYAGALFVMFPALVATLHSDDGVMVEGTMRALATSFVSCVMRLEMRYSKYTTWVVAIIFTCIAEHGIRFLSTCSDSVFSSSCDLHGIKLVTLARAIAWPCMVWAAGDTLACFRSAKRREENNGVEGKGSEISDKKHACIDAPFSEGRRAGG